MTRRLSLLTLLMSALPFTLAAHADTLAGRSGGTTGSILVNSPEGVSFSINGSFVDVSITAFASSSDHNPGMGTVYLTNQVGPGTTVANQVAVVSLTNVPYEPPTATTLFTGLSLGPGTYYLISSSGTPDGLAWEQFTGNTDLSGSEGTTGSDVVLFGAGSYPPSGIPAAIGSGFDYVVSGTPATASSITPEPSSFLLLGTGALGFVGLVRRRLA